MTVPTTRRFTVLRNPVRRLIESRPARTKASESQAHVAEAQMDSTPAPELQSEIISAFQLQHVHLPSSFEKWGKGATIGGRSAIVVSAFALASVVGAGVWFGARTSKPALEGKLQSTYMGVEPRKETHEVTSDNYHQAPSRSSDQHRAPEIPVQPVNVREAVAAEQEPAPKSNHAAGRARAVASKALSKPTPITHESEELPTGEPRTDLSAPIPAAKSPDVTTPMTTSISHEGMTTPMPRVYRMNSRESRKAGN